MDFAPSEILRSIQRLSIETRRKSGSVARSGSRTGRNLSRDEAEKEKKERKKEILGGGITGDPPFRRGVDSGI